jgi:hypothetical protein
MPLNRCPPQVFTVQLDQVKGAKDCITAVTAPADQVKHREAVVVGDDRLAVDQERSTGQC